LGLNFVWQDSKKSIEELAKPVPSPDRRLYPTGRRLATPPPTEEYWQGQVPKLVGGGVPCSQYFFWHNLQKYIRKFVAMGIIIRQSAKSSLVSYIGVLIGTFNVLYLYNKFLTAEQLGLYVALTSFPLVMAGFAHLGTPLVAVRFFNQFASDQDRHHGFLGYLLLVPAVGFTVFMVCYSLGKGFFEGLYGGHSPLLLRYFWVLPVLAFLMMYQSVLEAYCRSHLRIVVPAVLREVFLRLCNSLLALLFGFGLFGFDQLVLLLVLAYILALLALVFYVFWLGKLYLYFDIKLLNKPVFKEMCHYGFWTLLGGLAGIVLPHIEKIMLPAYKGGLQNTAIFNIAASIALVISIPRNTISAIADPLLADSLQKGNMPHVQEIYSKSALNLCIAGCLLFLGIWCNIDDLFALIPNSALYAQGKWVVLMVGLYSLFDMATGLNSEILKNSKYYRTDFAFYIIRFVVLLLINIVLIPKYSYNGAAMAMLVSMVIYNLVKFVYINQKLGIQPFGKAWVLVVALAIFTYLVLWFLGAYLHLGAIGNILVKGSVVLLLFGGGVLVGGLSADITNIYKTIWKKIK
jgi:O-antigen/teichoic acid export membrane protein